LSDRWILTCVVMLIVAVLSYLSFVPWGGSPETKLRLVLHAFVRYQGHLERLCRAHPLQLGELHFEQTGIPKTPYIDKRLPLLKVDVSVLVPEPDSLVLTVTVPEIAAQGIYSLWNSSAIPAGSTLRSRGRCERGTVYWSRLESTLPDELLEAALTAGIR